MKLFRIGTLLMFFFQIQATKSQEKYQKKLEFLHEKIVRTQYSKLDSMNHFIKELKRKIHSNDSVWLARYYSLRGIYYQQKSEYDSAKQAQRISLKIAKKIHDKRLQAKANQRLGVVFKMQGDLETSMKYFFTSRDLAYANKDTITGVTADLVIGQVYWRLKKYKKAVEQIDKAIKVAESSKEIFEDKQRKADVLSGIYLEKGNMLLMLGKLDESLKFYYKAEKLISNTGHREGLAIVFSNIGAIHFLKNDINIAIQYYKKGLQLSKEFKDEVSQGVAKMNLGEAYYNLNKFYSAEKELSESLQLFKKLKDKFNLVDNYGYLHELETRRKNYAKALQYYKLRVAYKDSILNEKNLAKISDLEVKYKTVEKEQQITQQNLELQTQKATIASQRNTQLLLLGGLGFFVLGGLLFYSRNKAQQKQKLQEAVLKEKEKGFASVIKASEDERKRISKDLHDGIGQQMSALKMALSNVKKQETNEVQKEQLSKILTRFTDSANEIRHISHQMMPKKLLDNGLPEAIEDLLFGSFEFSNIKYEFEHFNIKERFDERIEISLYRVLQELINNIIKHANATEVNVLLHKKNSKLVLFVEDNGVGMKEKDTKGHGVLNIKSRIDMVKGTVNYELSSISGTIATITIPL